MAQRGAHGLGAAKEQVMCGHQQGIHVEVTVRVLLLLRGLRGGDMSPGRITDHRLGVCANRSPQICTPPAGCVRSVPTLFNFLSSGKLGSAEGPGRENLSRRAHD